jgi:hypothetical protein
MNTPENDQSGGESRVTSSEMLEGFQEIQVEEGEDFKSVQLIIYDTAATIFLTLTMRQAQVVANEIQKIIDSKCQGKSVELYDMEKAASEAAIDQWNACERIERAANALKEEALRLLLKE